MASFRCHGSSASADERSDRSRREPGLVVHRQLDGHKGYIGVINLEFFVLDFRVFLVEFFVQKQKVELDKGVNGYAAHGKEIKHKHQVAEIDKSLVLSNCHWPLAGADKTCAWRRSFQAGTSTS